MVYYKKQVLLYILALITCFLTILLITHFENITFRVFEYAQKLGFYPDIYYNWFLGILCFVFLTFIVSLLNQKDLLYIWLIKGFITLVFMLIYEYKYGLDSYMYYTRAVYSDESTFFYAATDNLIYFTKLLTYLVGDSFYSLKIFYSFIGFIGILFLYKSYIYILKKSNIEVYSEKYFLYCIFLFPSILFWSSTLGKEPITLFFIGMFIFNFLKVIDEKKLINILFVIISIVGVYYIRPWWAIIFLSVVALNMLNLKSKKQVFFLISTMPILYYAVLSIFEVRKVTSFNDIFERLYSVAKLMSFGGSAIEVNNISTLWGYLYYYIPNLFTALFRPMFYDVNSLFTLFNAVENTLLLYVCVRYILLKPLEILTNKYLRVLLLFVFIWSLLYVVVSSANLGAAVRFKLQVLPIILIIVFIVRNVVLNRRKY